MIDSKSRAAIRKLRAKGRTYSEINLDLGLSLSKSSIAHASKGVTLPDWYKSRLADRNSLNLVKARKLSVLAKSSARKATIGKIEAASLGLLPVLANKQGARLVLAVLYLAEGSKSDRSSVMFGNSDPLIISLFLDLLRKSYSIDEGKFRCTVQGRSDQNFRRLEAFWSKVTRIPRTQFYMSRIDPRSVGKKSLKPKYKGVCRIDYFSAAVDLELKAIVRVIGKNYLGPIV